MQGFDATFDDVSFDPGRDSRKIPHIAIGAVAAASIGCVGGLLLIKHLGGGPDAGALRPAADSAPLPAAEVASNPFGEIIIEPGWLPGSAATAPNPNLSAQPKRDAVTPVLSAAIPLPPLEAIPPAFPSPSPGPGTVPQPPKRDIASIEDSAPLPPPRPPEFGPPAKPTAPERDLTQANARPAPAPADNRNFIQKLLGLAPSSGGAASPAPQGRSGGRSLFAAFMPARGFERLGYDRWTAVYDISARAVYLPDGTRLEAHSGLGNRLDDPRYVSERGRGPTPPHLYDLEPRETVFHGVQALRLTPVGDGDVFGRAGLLAHSYMLGPNGDSNGCVSVKDYDAFLRAYQSGQIKRLAVVASQG